MTDDLTAFVQARLTEDEMHAQKDIWCADRASADWEAHFGYNLPYSELRAGDQVIARFTGTRGLPLADGEDDQHQADLMLAARAANAAKPRAERMLREIAAKRAILAAHEAVLGECHTMELKADRRPRKYGEYDGLHKAVTELAAVYSGHPDYRQEWAPSPQQA